MHDRRDGVETKTKISAAPNITTRCPVPTIEHDIIPAVRETYYTTVPTCQSNQATVNLLPVR